MQTPPPVPPPFYDPEERPGSRSDKISMIWGIIATIYTLAALGLIFYWEFTDDGIPMMVREWQVKILDDEYYPFIDVAASLVLFVLPLFPVKLIVEKVTGVNIGGRVNRRNR